MIKYGQKVYLTEIEKQNLVTFLATCLAKNVSYEVQLLYRALSSMKADIKGYYTLNIREYRKLFTKDLPALTLTEKYLACELNAKYRKKFIKRVKALGLVHFDDILEELEQAQEEEESYKLWSKLEKETKKLEDTDKHYWLTYTRAIKTYFGVDVEVGQNAPKLAKQLKKHGIELSWDEATAFSSLEKMVKSFGLCYIDLADRKLPTDLYELDKWAFNGSCNSTSGCGTATAIALEKASDDFKYLKIYTYVDNLPCARAYYVENNGELGHAGGYYNKRLTNHSKFGFEGFLANPNEEYELTSLLLCLIYGKKLADFEESYGGIYCDNEGAVYSNMADCTSYKKYTTGNLILNDYCVEYLVYCENTDTYELEEDAHWCEYEEIWVAESGGYIWCDFLNEYFYEMRELHNRLGIEEY